MDSFFALHSKRLSPKVLSLSPLPLPPPLSLSAPFTFRCSCLFCSFRPALPPPPPATGSSQEKLFCFHFRHFTTFLLLPPPLLFLLLQLRNFSRSSLWGEERKGCLLPLLPELSQLLLQLSFTALHFFCSSPRTGRAAREATHCILAQKRKVCPGARAKKKDKMHFGTTTGTAKLLGKRFDFIFRTFVAASHTASDAPFFYRIQKSLLHQSRFSATTCPSILPLFSHRKYHTTLLSRAKHFSQKTPFTSLSKAKKGVSPPPPFSPFSLCRRKKPGLHIRIQIGPVQPAITPFPPPTSPPKAAKNLSVPPPFPSSTSTLQGSLLS